LGVNRDQSGDLVEDFPGSYEIVPSMLVPQLGALAANTELDFFEDVARLLIVAAGYNNRHQGFVAAATAAVNVTLDSHFKCKT